MAALAAALILGLVLGGCGGDDEGEDQQPAATVPDRPAPAPVTTPPPETAPTEDEPDPDAEPRTVPPEERQGDEEPIRSEAVFTGRGGRLTPRQIRVPAFIAVRVILRSSEGLGRDRGYMLAIGGKRLVIGHTRSVDEATLPGLRPNRAYKGRSPQGNVRIVASGEPGP